MISGRTFSHPNLSLKDQDLYIRTQKFVKGDIPLLFGAFCHNIDNNKAISFTSRFYNYVHGIFETLPYDIVNIKDTNYATKLNPVANKVNINIKDDLKSTEDLIDKLKTYMNESVNEIENKHQRIFKDIKILLKNELEDNKRLLEKLKTFET